MHAHCIKDVVNFKRLRDEHAPCIDQRMKRFLLRFDISKLMPFIFGTMEKKVLLIYLQVVFSSMSHRIYGGPVLSEAIQSFPVIAEQENVFKCEISPSYSVAFSKVKQPGVERTLLLGTDPISVEILSSLSSHWSTTYLD